MACAAGAAAGLPGTVSPGEGAAGVSGSRSRRPHASQNLWPAWCGVPHAAHVNNAVRLVPHEPQKLAPGLLGWPQEGHSMAYAADRS
jgi:hypothetical protein